MLIHALSADIIDISCLKLTLGFYIRRSFQQRPLSFRAIFFFTIKCISTLFSCSTHQTNFSRKQWLQTGPLIYKFMKCREKEKNRFNSRFIKASTRSLFPSVRNCIRNLTYWSIWWRGFICTFSLLISLSITLWSSKFRNQFKMFWYGVLPKMRDLFWSYLFRGSAKWHLNW